MYKRIILIGLLLCACNEPDPQIQTQIDGIKADLAVVSEWVDSLAVRDSVLSGQTEQLEIANTRQDSELTSITRQLNQWPLDSLKWFLAELRSTGQRLQKMQQVIDSLKGPIGTLDSLGNVCYTVEPDQTFRYFLYHTFRDTLGNYEEGIRYHTAIEAYRTVADLYAGRQYDKSSLDYQWHDYDYARFKDVAILTKDGLVLRLPVNVILPYRNMYYVIAHAVIDKAGNESTWNRSIDEGYYARIK